VGDAVEVGESQREEIPRNMRVLLNQVDCSPRSNADFFMASDG